MIQLIVKRGKLHIPHAAITDRLVADFYRRASSLDPILVCHYPDGDCDTIPWPMTSGKHNKTLAGALYDSREMGLVPDESVFLLPDGKEFCIETNL